MGPKDARVTYESYSKKDDWHHLAIVNARYSQKGEVVARESQATH